jgi:membrane protein
MAASFAHYAFASLVPLLLLAMVALSYLGLAGAFVDLVRSSLSASGATLLERALTAERGRGIAGAAGLLLSLWSGLKVFRGLSTAFARVYDAGSDPSLFDELKDGVVVLGLVLLAFGLLAGTGLALAFVTFGVPYPRLVGNLLAVVAVAVALLPVYYVLPPVPVTLRHVLPGTAFAAVGVVLLQVGFTYYAGEASRYAAYGLLGAVLLFVLFLYFAGIVLLLGAVLNVAIERPTPRATLTKRR